MGSFICRRCGAQGFTMCTHGKSSKKKYIVHTKPECLKKKFNFSRRRKPEKSKKKVVKK